MNKIISIFLIICGVISCGTLANQRQITNKIEQRRILVQEGQDAYVSYLDEKVATFSMKEVPDSADTKKYVYAPYYKNARVREFGKQMALLKEQFPELYNLFIEGKIALGKMYQYVDQEDGKIKVHVNYKYVNDWDKP